LTLIQEDFFTIKNANNGENIDGILKLSAQIKAVHQSAQRI